MTILKVFEDSLLQIILGSSIKGYLHRRVQNFPAWHTKVMGHGKCCKGYIVLKETAAGLFGMTTTALQQ